MVDRLPGLLVRLEGVAVAAAGIALYVHGDGSWWLFAVLALAPDLSLLGYLAGPRIGAVAYDLAHTYVAPVVLAATGVLTDAETAVQVGLIWATHIGVDRALGYGLMYPSGFRDTHLQRL